MVVGRKNSVGETATPDIKLIKIVWYQHNNRLIDQWNKTESSEMSPSVSGKLLFNKEEGSIKWNKNSLFNKCYWEIWTATCKKMKLDHQLTHHIKINSIYIKIYILVMTP